MSAVLTKLDDLKVKTIDDVSNDIPSNKTEVKSIYAGLSALEPRVSVMEKLLVAEENIEIVKSKVFSNSSRLTKLGNSPGTSMKAVVAEKDDRRKICNVIYAIHLQAAQFSSYRLVKKSGRDPRPLKLILGSQNEAVCFMKTFSQDAVSRLDPSLSNVSISRDRTPNERTTLDSL
ncbi:hypothetical protein J6590_062503 [Homalodisca vitripennis]|nr:hypothetical protein J6590_062503 [Homalodisca vitripennis]